MKIEEQNGIKQSMPELPPALGGKPVVERIPVTGREVSKGFIFAVGINLVLAALLFYQLGAFGTGGVAEFNRMIAAGVLSFLQLVMFAVSLVKSFRGRNRGAAIGFLLGSSLALLATFPICVGSF